MKEDKKFIKVYPDEFAKLDYKIAIEMENLTSIEECGCFFCEEFGSHFEPSNPTSL